MEKGKMSAGLKYCLWLLLWWLSLGFVIQYNSAAIGIAFLTLFFLATAWRKLKAIAVGMVVVALICAIFPAIIPFFVALGVIGLLFKIKFLYKNWRPLLVGAYAYGVYAFIVVFLKTKAFATYLFSLLLAGKLPATIEQAQGTALTWQGIDLFAVYQYSPFIIAGILALILHLLVRWLHRNSYDTDTAFAIMGMTPLILLGLLLPAFRRFKANDFAMDALDTVADIAESNTTAANAAADALPAAENLLSDATIDAISTAAENLANDTIANVAANAAADTVSRSVADAVSDAVSDRVSASAASEIRDAVADAVHEPIAGIVRDTVSEAVPESVENLVHGAAKNVAPHLREYAPAARDYVFTVQNAKNLSDAVATSLDGVPEYVHAAAAAGAAASAVVLDEDKAEIVIADLGKFKLKYIDKARADILSLDGQPVGELLADSSSNCKMLRFFAGETYVIGGEKVPLKAKALNGG